MFDLMVAFDFVGTLVRKEIFVDARKDLRLDCNDGWASAENLALFYSSFNYESVFGEWLDYQRKIASKMLFNQFAHFLIEHATTSDYLYREVPSTLIALNAQGVNLGFVSDGVMQVEGAMIKKILTSCGISDEQIIVTGEMTGFIKEKQKPFLKLIELANTIGVDEERIVFIGDKPSADIDGTIGTGIKAILVNRGSQQIPIGKKQPLQIVENLTAIISLLPEIFQS